MQHIPHHGQFSMARRGRVAGGHADHRKVPEHRVGTRVPRRVRGQDGQVHVDRVERPPVREKRERAAGRGPRVQAEVPAAHSVGPEHAVVRAQVSGRRPPEVLQRRRIGPESQRQ